VRVDVIAVKDTTIAFLGRSIYFKQANFEVFFDDLLQITNFGTNFEISV